MTAQGPRDSVLPERPKLRAELELTDAVERGIQYTYVRDPASRRYTRIGATARLAASLMDGTRNVETIVRDLSASRGEQVPRAAVDKLVADFTRLGFFENQTLRRKAPGARGDVLYYIVPLVDPDRALDRVAFLWRILVSLPVASLIGVLIIAGAAAYAWGLSHGSLPQLGELSIADTVLLYALSLLVVGGHELAHAFTLKRFGGEVHEMGVALIYFQPCLFCNVTDAYRLPKARRLWVSFAGIYFQLAVWGGATLIAGWLGPQDPIGRAALLLTMVSGILAVFVNLNPLLKLDGYYMLADWLEIPNLRARAFAFVRTRIARIFRGPSDADPRPRDAREAIILVVYGVLASAFVVVFLGAGIVWSYRTLRSPAMNLPTVLAAVVGSFLLIRVARAVWRMTRRLVFPRGT